MTPSYDERLKCFRSILARGQGGRNADAYLVVNQQNIRYLSGFTGDSSWVLISDAHKVIFTDSRYTQQAREECPAWTVVQTDTGLVTALGDYSKRHELTCIALDYGLVSMELDQRLELAMGAQTSFVGLEGPCYKLRCVKDPGELSTLRRAFHIADEALALLRPKIKPGVSERELALDLYCLIHRLGGDDISFDTIVASGPQGALPHAKPTDYQLKKGDFITIDYGVVLDGYHSDTTRTFVIGKPDKTQIDRYELVLGAQKKALDGIRAGVTTKAIDALARDHISGAGYGEYFGHGLGHGIGLEIHENPRLSPLSGDTTLESGMVVTIEPGIYIPGWGGLRTEDSVVVTDDAYENLTSFPKKLEELVV